MGCDGVGSVDCHYSVVPYYRTAARRDAGLGRLLVLRIRVGGLWTAARSWPLVPLSFERLPEIAFGSWTTSENWERGCVQQLSRRDADPRLQISRCC